MESSIVNLEEPLSIKIYGVRHYSFTDNSLNNGIQLATLHAEPAKDMRSN